MTEYITIDEGSGSNLFPLIYRIQDGRVYFFNKFTKEWNQSMHETKNELIKVRGEVIKLDTSICYRFNDEADAIEWNMIMKISTELGKEIF